MTNWRNIKTRLSKEPIALISVVATIILAIFTLFRDYRQDERLNYLAHWTNALQFRPHLKVVTPIEIIGYKLDQGKIAVRDLLSRDSVRRVVGRPTTITLDVKLSVHNVGNSPAKVHATIQTDTTTGLERLRNRLLSGDTTRIVLSSEETYYESLEIAAGDSSHFNLTFPIQYVDSSRFTLHFLIVYENDLGILYDTYFLARYETHTLVTTPEFRIQGNVLQMRLIAVEGSFRDFLKLVDSNQSLKIYSEDQGNAIRKYFGLLARRTSSNDN